MSMKLDLPPILPVLFSADAVTYPLTGIGRYAIELAAAIEQRGDVRLRFVANGHAVIDPVALSRPTAPIGVLRRYLPFKGPLLRLQRWVRNARVPRLARELGAMVFHSPSFSFPPVPIASVVTIHDLAVVRYPQSQPAYRVDAVTREIERAVKGATRIIAPTEAVRQELIAEYAVDSKTVRAVHCGIAPKFRPKTADETRDSLQPLGLTHGGFLLCVATIEPRKNIATLLDAYERLPVAVRARMPLVIAGAGGWSSDALQDRLRRSSASHVHWLRYVGDDQLIDLYAGSRAFVLPSLYEGFGLPVVEAMGSGTAVLAADIACFREVVGSAGRLVPPLDVEGWTTALRQLVDDDTLRSSLAASARARAEHFSWERSAQATVEVYRAAARDYCGASVAGAGGVEPTR